MLAPDNRELLLEALRPPDGYQFDRGVGTTFSLDLLTLLIAPLSLAFMEVTKAEEALGDPVLLLEGLQRHADRLAIFCHAGRIAIPRAASHLYRYLEDTIVEVEAPGGGVFHPKLWLLRYLAGDAPPLYRCLCLTRNLTFDKSWDLMLRLEGQLADRQLAYARNHPLGDFIQALPGLATHPVADRIERDVDLLADEVRRVAFQPPEPFDDDLTFHPIGIAGYGGYNFRHDYSSVLVVSPFLSRGVLLRATQRAAGHSLISRADGLGDLSAGARGRFENLYILNDRVLGEAAEEQNDEVGEEMEGAESEPSELHAKLFVFDTGWDSYWLLGSANATDAAFRGNNVEFMVRLSGRKSRVGIDKVLGMEDDDLSLRALLTAYEPSAEANGYDQKGKQVEALADQVRAWLIAFHLELGVVKKGDNRFDMLLRRTDPAEGAPSGDYKITCWPLTLRPEQGLDLSTSPVPERWVFADLSLLALTPFLAFEVVARKGHLKHTLRFVLNLPISGMPEARDDHVLSAIISDRAGFLRYLRLILAGEEDLLGAVGTWLPMGIEENLSKKGGGDVTMPLLEELVRALSRAPRKIERIERLVERLRRTEAGRALMPEGFEALWQLITETRRNAP
jgi:hypothetical protein